MVADTWSSSGCGTLARLSQTATVAALSPIVADPAKTRGGTLLAFVRRVMGRLIAYLLSAMLAWSPAADHAYYEAREQTLQRYTRIAEAIARVAVDPSEASLFGGPDGRAETALLIASIAFHESGGFRRDVQLGTGSHGRGDGGRSWCLMQVNIGHGMTAERWTGEDLVADQDKCIRAGLHRIRESFMRCSGKTFVDRLSGYTDGHCRDGALAARRRTERAVSFWAGHPY